MNAALQKVWYFLWKEDSVASWLINIFLAFVLIRYLLYPVLGIVLGTGYPIVAVVSESMEHEPTGGILCGQQFSEPASFATYWQACGSWYQQRNISSAAFRTFPFSHGFYKGDIILLWRAHPENIQVGDVLVFRGEKPQPIIHRVVRAWPEQGHYFYQTKGDHNMDSIPGESGEIRISSDRIYGKGVLRIPYLGWIKVLFVQVMQWFGITIQR